MTSQPRDKTRDSTKHDTAKFGIDCLLLSVGETETAQCSRDIDYLLLSVRETDTA